MKEKAYVFGKSHKRISYKANIPLLIFNNVKEAYCREAYYDKILRFNIEYTILQKCNWIRLYTIYTHEKIMVEQLNK